MEEERLYALDEDIKILENLVVTLENHHLGGGKEILHLIEVYRKLEEKNRKLDEKFKYAVPDNIVEENYIPKSKIKEKIEELQKYMIEDEFQDYSSEIDILQELLEEE